MAFGAAFSPLFIGAWGETLNRLDYPYIDTSFQSPIHRGVG